MISNSGAFEGEDVTHVEGEVNPVRDLEIISEELRKKVSMDTHHFQELVGWISQSLNVRC